MKDTASSSSSSHSPVWSSTRGPRRSVLRTMEKSVVFRVRTQEQISNGRGPSNGSSQHKTLYLTQGEGTRGTDDADVNETLAELYAEVEQKKQWLNREEQTFQRGQERLDSLQREEEALLRNLEQCKRRRKERVRIQKMLHGPQAESDSDDYNGSSSESDCSSHKHRRRSNSHCRPRRDGAKKERKRLRRFQSDVSLRFQLLQSECRRSDLQVEKLMVDLRREYADSCLFGNSLNF